MTSLQRMLRAAWRLSLRPIHPLMHRPTRRFFFLAFCLPVALLFGLVVALPAALTRSSPARYPYDGPGPQKEGTAAACPAQGPLPAAIDSLKAIEAFLNTRLVLAEQESFSLAVNLVDSTLLLAIRGVPIREVPILHYRLSEALEYTRRQGCLTPWASQPFTLQQSTATITKAPVRIVSAPRDTLEAQARPPDSIPLETNETHFILHFDRSLTLRVRQPSSSYTGSVEKVLLDAKEHARTATRTMARLARGKTPEHERWITLILSPEDAKAVYRALPDNAKLALRL